MSNIILLVTGSRSINSEHDELKIWQKLDELKTSVLPHKIVGLVEGEAEGVDKTCARWAVSQGITVTRVEATAENWEKHGRQAGIMRNIDMFNIAKNICDLNDALLYCIAFWDGVSTGTEHMIKHMKKNEYPVDVHLMGKPKTKRLFG